MNTNLNEVPMIELFGENLYLVDMDKHTKASDIAALVKKMQQVFSGAQLTDVQITATEHRVLVAVKMRPLHRPNPAPGC